MPLPPFPPPVFGCWTGEKDPSCSPLRFGEGPGERFRAVPRLFLPEFLFRRNSYSAPSVFIRVPHFLLPRIPIPSPLSRTRERGRGVRVNPEFLFRDLESKQASSFHRRLFCQQDFAMGQAAMNRLFQRLEKDRPGLRQAA